MDEKTAKILFVLGMTLSFPVVLAVMVSLLDSPSTAGNRSSRAPSQRPTRQTEIARDVSAVRTDHRPATVDSSRKTAVSLSESPSSAEPATAKLASLRPDPEAVQQLATLKKGLQQELDAAKQTRDTLLVSLARGLAQLSAAEAAAELRQLDDEQLTALCLHHLAADRRKAILVHFDAQSAGRIQRRLRTLASR